MLNPHFASSQLKAKRNECNSKSTHARNDYLLTLAAANAHQLRYYNTDIMDCIKVRPDAAVYTTCVCVFIRPAALGRLRGAHRVISLCRCWTAGSTNR